MPKITRHNATPFITSSRTFYVRVAIFSCKSSVSAYSPSALTFVRDHGEDSTLFARLLGKPIRQDAHDHAKAGGGKVAFRFRRLEQPIDAMAQFFVQTFFCQKDYLPHGTSLACDSQWCFF